MLRRRSRGVLLPEALPAGLARTSAQEIKPVLHRKRSQRIVAAARRRLASAMAPTARRRLNKRRVRRPAVNAAQAFGENRLRRRACCILIGVTESAWRGIVGALARRQGANIKWHSSSLASRAIILIIEAACRARIAGVTAQQLAHLGISWHLVRAARRYQKSNNLARLASLSCRSVTPSASSVAKYHLITPCESAHREIIS